MNATLSPITKTKFELIAMLEAGVAHAQNAFDQRPPGIPVFQTDQMLKAVKDAKQDLYDAVDQLTSDEIRAYGKYRLKN